MQTSKPLWPDALIWWKHHPDKRCAYCGKPVDPAAPLSDPTKGTIDHYVPVSRGGSVGMENWKASCRRCNEGKRNLLPEEFITFLEKE